MILLLPLLLFRKTNKQTQRDTKYKMFLAEEEEDLPNDKFADYHFMCPTWAQDGECNNWNDDDYDATSSVIHLCPRSCLVQTLYSHMVDDALQGIEYVVPDEYCEDEDKEICSTLVAPLETVEADREACIWNKDIQSKCRKSCKLCFENETASFGVPQYIDQSDPLALEALGVLKKTTIYMRNEVWNDDVASMHRVRYNCQNFHEDCTWRAGAGHCQNPLYLVEMQLYCSPACRACHMIPIRKRCPPSDHATAVLNRQQDMNALFQNVLQSHPESNTSIFSRPNGKQASNSQPWIVMLDSFMTLEETKRLIQIGYEIGYEASTAISDEVKKDQQQQEQHVHEEWRTSQTAWCDRACQESEPLVNQVVERILLYTGLPRSSMERVQLLKYNDGQFYVPHHDHIESQRYLPCGPRILTFFLYLNTVPSKSGGGTRFDSYSTQSGCDGCGGSSTLVVQPKEGRALLWPNVLDSNYPTEMDYRTFHEALAVQKDSTKYAANVWFHLHDYESASKRNCI
mmetsp:Transcript_1734/g.2758  ORF Transcript_1734/g.2758 Transcript_1734/m.2758 type:complete len:514 (+) Transcript_1734:2-1543(+)